MDISIHQIKWSLIKRAANSGYARLTVLVPVIGWFLVANNEFSKVLSKLTGVESIALPSWKLYALHAGLSIFGIGVGLFYLLCPIIIKSYVSFEEFAKVDMETITSTQLDKYNEELNHNNAIIPSQTALKSLAFPQEGSEVGRDVWQNRNKDLILKTQYNFYNLKDLSNPNHRRLILCFLIPGSLLTFIPSLMTIIWSLWQLFKVPFDYIFQ